MVVMASVNQTLPPFRAKSLFGNSSHAASDSSDKNLRNRILSAIISPHQAITSDSLQTASMRKSRALPILAILFSCLASTLGTGRALTPVDVSFPTQTVLSTEQPYGSAIIVADFDGDGRPDVAAASLLDSEIAWYRNLGDGTFSPGIVISKAAMGPSSIVAADIDADGRIDIVSASTLDNKIAWYRNVGGAPGTLFGYNPSVPAANQRVISRSAEYAYSVTVADVNGDGLWDVVSASLFDHKIAYYTNLGAGNFGYSSANPNANQHVISTAGKAPSCVAAGDLDGDGVTDLAVTSVNDDTLAWFKGGYDENGNPTFTRYVLSTDQPRAYNVAIADMNKDRSPDLIVASPFGNKISYFRNLTPQSAPADSLFAPEQIVSSEARGASAVAAADINRDGNLDIVSALLLDDRIIWFPSNGPDENGEVTFGPEALVSAGTEGPAGIAAADFDGDGVLDVTSTSQVDSKVAVFLNAGEFDGDVTLPPTLTAPTTGTVTTTPVTVAYTLPEDALPGSVTISFTSGATYRELIVASEGESAGAHSFSFNPANPGESSAIQSASTAIKDGTYTVYVSYQDAVGNPAVASLPSTGVVIDAEAPFLPGASTTVLAKKGAAVPGAGVSGSGIPSDATLRVLGVPSINDGGDLALTATYSSGAATRQVIIGPNANDETAVLVGAGDPVPSATGALQTQLAFTGFADVLLNDADAVAFIGNVRGLGAAASTVTARNDRGIWTNAGAGQLRQVAREYDAAAGLNLRYSVFTSVALSSKFVRGEDATERTNVAFTAKLVGTGVVAANDEALWVYEVTSAGDATTRLLLRKGQNISLRGAAAKRIRGIVALAPIDGAAGHGRGSAAAGVVARLEFSDATQAVVNVGGDGVVTPVAITGDIVPDTDARLVRFGLPVQNDLGDAIISASLTSRTNNAALIFAPFGGDESIVARQGDLVNDIDDAAFSSFKVGVVNSAQNFAFIGKAIGRGVNANNDDGLWYFGQSGENPGTGAPVLVAREGQQAAGTAAGAKWEAFRSIALPDGSNGPIFLADLVVPLAGAPNPARVTASNDTGVWAVDSNGVLRLIVREGDIFPGTSLTIRAIAILGNVAGSPAQTRSFNSHSDLVYRATLSDGSEVIAKAHIP